MKKLLLAAAALTAATAAQAGIFNEVENNDTLATANLIDGYFTTDFSADIGNTTTNTSTTIPHVTVNAFSEAGGRDTFKFTVTTAGSLGIFDIDYGRINNTGFDPNVAIYDAAGERLAINDDAEGSYGQGGTVHSYDSYLQYTFATAGTYFVQIGSCCDNLAFSPYNGIGSNYQLQVSLQNPNNDVPEPAMLGLFGLGALALGLSRRKA